MSRVIVDIRERDGWIVKKDMTEKWMDDTMSTDRDGKIKHTAPTEVNLEIRQENVCLT